MGRGKEPDQPTSNPLEAKKHRDEAAGHFKNGNYDRALNSLDKVTRVHLHAYDFANRYVKRSVNVALCVRYN